MTTDKCWYKGVCEQKCSTSCIRFMEMKSLLEQSNLPERRWFPETLVPDDCDYDMFCFLSEVKDTIDYFVFEGLNMYIYSDKTGNGKTSWAIKLMLKYFDKVWAGNGFKCRGLFIHVPTFLTQLKNFDTVDENLERIKEILPEVDIVIWDDIASTNLSNYDHGQLITYIDQRILNKKTNIFTGNLRKEGMDKSLGARLSSRVWNSSSKVELKGSDKR